MLTPFGVFIRKLRIDSGMLLKNMAEQLGVTSSYLSAVETGKRNIPTEWPSRIALIFNLSSDSKAELNKAIQESQTEIQINLNNLSRQQRDLALVFARKLDGLDEAKIQDVFKAFKKSDTEE